MEWSPIKACRFSATVHCSVKILVDLLEKTSTIKQIDPMMEVYDRLEEVCVFVVYVYISFKKELSPAFFGLLVFFFLFGV